MLLLASLWMELNKDGIQLQLVVKYHLKIIMQHMSPTFLPKMLHIFHLFDNPPLFNIPRVLVIKLHNLLFTIGSSSPPPTSSLGSLISTLKEYLPTSWWDCEASTRECHSYTIEVNFPTFRKRVHLRGGMLYVNNLINKPCFLPYIFSFNLFKLCNHMVCNKKLWDRVSMARV